MTLAEIRAQFPHTAHRLYVNHASTAPLSRPVRAAMAAYLAERGGAGAGDPIDNFETAQPKAERARQRLAAVLGTRPARVAFTANTSAALGVLTRGLDWQPGDRIALPGCEFPTNVYPFLNLEDRGVAVDFIPHTEGTFTLAAVADTLRPETRLLSVSWVQFLSGFRADLAALGALCRDRDVLFCVDAIQGLGALTLDVEALGIDFLAAGTWKWLMATQGLGLLYCSEALQARLRPEAGWLHGPVDWDDFFRYDLQFHDDARRFELGTANRLGLVALDAALGLYLDAGPAWCERRVLALARRLADGLADAGLPRYGTDAPAHASGIVTVRPDAPDALLAHLADHGVTAAARNRCVRFSPTWYMVEEEMDAVVEGAQAFVEGAGVGV
jgi:selenocysteine lyase/cysteine desulfurase